MPLSPVGNPAENITIARPGDASLREPKLARPHFDWGLVDLSKFAQQRFSRMPDSSVALWLALRVATAINDDERLEIG